MGRGEIPPDLASDCLRERREVVIIGCTPLTVQNWGRARGSNSRVGRAMEEELEARSQSRAKADRQRSDLAKEIDQLWDRLVSGMDEARDRALLLLQTRPGWINLSC